MARYHLQRYQSLYSPSRFDALVPAQLNRMHCSCTDLASANEFLDRFTDDCKSPAMFSYSVHAWSCQRNLPLLLKAHSPLARLVSSCQLVDSLSMCQQPKIISESVTVLLIGTVCCAGRQQAACAFRLLCTACQPFISHAMWFACCSQQASPHWLL